MGLKAYIDLIRAYRAYRKSKYADEYCILTPESELNAISNSIGYAAATQKLYAECVDHLIRGGCACAYCEDKDECDKAKRNKRGCVDFMIRWPTKEEIKCACPKDFTEAGAGKPAEDLPEGLEQQPQLYTENSVCSSGENPSGGPQVPEGDGAGGTEPVE